MQLTDEQKQVIAHPDGYHAKVLSVAGSGKTTTMAYRIKYLLEERQVSPRQIRVLMFNRNAREQFEAKLREIGIPTGQGPRVGTFHSYALEVIRDTSHVRWFDQALQEVAHLELRKAVDRVRRKLQLDEDDLDVGEAERAISLWKSELIPPSRAGYRGNLGDAYAAIYKDFERRRRDVNAITFDDFVPLAINRLESDQLRHESFVTGVKYIIVDEYQDVNFGQQRLIEILASSGADVMVVGDDDQTIYEWRGARSDYILGEFDAVFSNKPHSRYKLTNSFRFGYLIAQSSYNVISHNAERLAKDVLSSKPDEDSNIGTFADSQNGGGDSNRGLSEEIVTLVKAKGVAPPDIRVLGRTYAQLSGLQAELLLGKIPFKVIGQSSFLQAKECSSLLDYLRVAAMIHEVPTQITREQFINIANKPRRYLARHEIERMIDDARLTNISLSEHINLVLEKGEAFANARQLRNLTEMRDVLGDLYQMLNDLKPGAKVELSEPMGTSSKISGNKTTSAKEPRVGPILTWLDERVGFREHYEDYYGSGEASLERVGNLNALISYAVRQEVGWREFLNQMEQADTTLGLPEDQCILMTTIHRVKGLEFDYVIIPNCQEGHMPVILGNDDPTYDKSNERQKPKQAEWIENERRLFYVGATRAKKTLLIGSPKIPLGSKSNSNGTSSSTAIKSSRFIEEMELEPTRAVAEELLRAARGDSDNKLAEVLQGLPGYHLILSTAKSFYSQFFSSKDKQRLERVKIGSAERPFRYKQAYDSPEKTKTNDGEGGNGIWGHIELD